MYRIRIVVMVHAPGRPLAHQQGALQVGLSFIYLSVESKNAYDSSFPKVLVFKPYPSVCSLNRRLESRDTVIMVTVRAV